MTSSIPEPESKLVFQPDFTNTNSALTAMQPRPLSIYAHRGSTLLAPENTPEAFDIALAHGAHVLETDVRLSSDNTVIVTHDESVDRITNGRGVVRELSVSQLKELDAGHEFTDLNGHSYHQTGVRLISLDELYERYPSVLINIDIKDNESEAAQQVADCIKRHGREITTTVGSFHQEVIRHFRKVAPHIRTAATKEEVATLYFRYLLGRSPPKDLPYGVLQIPTSYFNIPLTLPGFIQYVQTLNIGVIYWTINTKEEMQRLAKLQVDGIVTDRSDLAYDVLAGLK